MSFSFSMHTLDIGINYLIGSSPELKQATKASKYIVNTVIETDFSETSLHSQNKIIQCKYQHKIIDINNYANNVLFFSC